jgi:hypothetical protein
MDPLVVAGLAGLGREHADQLHADATDLPGFRVELQRVLGDDQTQQLGIAEQRVPARDMSSGQADPGQDPVIVEDVKCGQGVLSSLFTPSV